MSARRARRSAVLLVPLLLPCALVACGRGGDDTADAPPQGPRAEPRRVEPLGSEDLAGLDPAKVVLNMPWGGGNVSRDPQAAAARATLRSLELEKHPAFDRVVMEISTDAAFPGYQVAWADSTLSGCGGEAPVRVGATHALVLSLRPAQARDDAGKPTVAQRQQRPRYPAIREARQTCDNGGLVQWLVTVEDSAAVRVIELRDPRRLMVDVQHPGASAREGDSAAAGGTAGG